MKTITPLTSMCAGIFLSVFALNADAQVVKQQVLGACPAR
jgi:hypothetical protein